MSQEPKKEERCCEKCFYKTSGGLIHCTNIAFCPCYKREKSEIGSKCCDAYPTFLQKNGLISQVKLCSKCFKLFVPSSTEKEEMKKCPNCQVNFGVTTSRNCPSCKNKLVPLLQTPATWEEDKFTLKVIDWSLEHLKEYPHTGNVKKFAREIETIKSSVRLLLSSERNRLVEAVEKVHKDGDCCQREEVLSIIKGKNE